MELFLRPTTEALSVVIDLCSQSMFPLPSTQRDSFNPNIFLSDNFSCLFWCLISLQLLLLGICSDCSSLSFFSNLRLRKKLIGISVKSWTAVSVKPRAACQQISDNSITKEEFSNVIHGRPGPWLTPLLPTEQSYPSSVYVHMVNSPS